MVNPDHTPHQDPSSRPQRVKMGRSGAEEQSREGRKFLSQMRWGRQKLGCLASCCLFGDRGGQTDVVRNEFGNERSGDALGLIDWD